MSEQPLVREIEFLDPLAALARLPRGPGTVFLDSAMPQPDFGRRSYVAVDPFGRFSAWHGTAFWNGRRLEGVVLDALRQRLRTCRLAAPGGAAGLPLGATGFFAYEAGRMFERLPPPRPAAVPCPDIDLWFHDVAVVFDVVDRRAFIVSSGLPEAEPGRRLRRRRERLEWLADLLARPAPPPAPAIVVAPQSWRSNMSPEAFRGAVARVRELITAGDVFQANIAQRFSAELPAGFDPLALYAQARAANPAPFGALILDERRLVASTSPERFLRLADGIVETRPIKGTRPRSLDPRADRRLGEELLASEKDRAENVMIVDLLRNDLSRVSRPGTVEVPALCRLESYASVHHLVSVVAARLKPNADALDLLAACFPGGSITGAPKIRAMEIIHEIEPDPRGVYCGSILHLGFDGSLDSSIVIRTLVVEDGVASVHAGAGITLLSDPEEEHVETLVKADRLFRAFDSPAARRSTA